ncbi:thiamine diphosphokinase [Bacillus sp. B15-48]|nr:thiamine diphosphokinase [Bacillus sp. B15-48]
MVINIVGGGPVSLLPDLNNYDSDRCLWIGVDKGVMPLVTAGIIPDYAVGDFDSITEQEWQQIENLVTDLKRFQPEKDETDMELAINWALKKKPKKINLFGATGGRLDHFFGNIQLLLKPELQHISTQIEIIDCNNQIFIKGPGRYSIARSLTRKYISFVPMTPVVKGLTLSGFKYPLNNCHISFGSTLCISNELVSDAGTFSFTEGIVLVVRSSD